MLLRSPEILTNIEGYIKRWFSDLGRKLFFFIFLSMSLLLCFSFFSSVFNPFSTFVPLATFIFNCRTIPTTVFQAPGNCSRHDGLIKESRIAVCLVGGARRFELTGPSIIEHILQVYPNSDLFLHSPLDQNAFKFSLLKEAPRIAAVRIFEPKPIPETVTQLRVLTAADSPNAIQGLLQYFSLVEGCLTMINDYQTRNNFTYDWIVRTRVDGYWNAPLESDFFVQGHYLVPPGSTYGGLNDRLGIGDFNLSTVALSRLSLIPQLELAGFRKLNSETAFQAQLTTQNVSFLTKSLPFCIVSDRKYRFPPGRFGVPVAAMSSPGPLSGVKCRPCQPACVESCVAEVMSSLNKSWSWTDEGNGTMKLCDAHRDWEIGWEDIFDKFAGEKLASARVRVQELKMKQCVDDFSTMKGKAYIWESPPLEDICKLGRGEG